MLSVEGRVSLRYNKCMGEQTLPGEPDSKTPESFEVLTQRALETVQSQLKKLKGAGLVVDVAQTNIIKQYHVLEQARRLLRSHGSATVSDSGRYRTYHSEAEIETRLAEIRADLSLVADAQYADFTDFVDHGLPVVDKYIFDNRNHEAAEREPLTITVISTSETTRQISHPQDAVRVVPIRKSANPRVAYLLYKAAQEQAGIEPVSADKFIATMYQPEGAILEKSSSSDLIIIPIQADDSQLKHTALFPYKNELNQLHLELELKQKDAPFVIIYTHGFKLPLGETATYPRFIFCSSQDEVRNMTALVRELKSLKNAPSFMSQEVIAFSQQKLYDNSDLREWEGQTADTLQSLKHVIPLLSKNGAILDCGTGEGRIGGILARIGYNVFGIDISQNQLDRGRERIKEEGAGLRSEAINSLLSYNALSALEAEGLVAQADIEKDDATVASKYLTAQANFLTLHRDMHTSLRDWDKNHPNVNKRNFFGTSKNRREPFSNPMDLFADVGFETIMFNWHTFCEVGTPDNQRSVLIQAFQMLKPGGRIIIEIPDRMVGPYAHSLTDYHKAHPNEPLGTIRDSTSTEPGEATTQGNDEDTPRYFPDRNELVLLLQAVGFEPDNVETYLITKQDDAGDTHLQAKELFFCAQKPLAMAPGAAHPLYKAVA